jgi:hypothetical protein
MAIGRPPSMYVSSTCYDLKQVRADLRAFIESLGLHPVVSEYDSFPIDPSVTAVENCLQVVDERADLFLLIVGGRYGSTNEQGKSITNMEYLRARAKGIPIYVFIEKSVLSVLPVWKANPDGDFSGVVDSPKLFDFVSRLRDSDGVWTNSFEVAQQITEGLRKQLAYLFMDALELRKRVTARGLPQALLDLQGMPLRLTIERPPFWEYRLFAHSFAQEIERIKQGRWDLQYGIALGAGAAFRETSEVLTWVSKKIGEGRRISNVLAQIINVTLQEAFGPPGVSGDPVKIVYASQRLALAYRSTIEWALDARRVAVPDECKRLVEIVGTFLTGITEDIEAFSERVLRETEDAIANPPGHGESRVLDFKFDLKDDW